MRAERMVPRTAGKTIQKERSMNWFPRTRGDRPAGAIVGKTLPLVPPHTRG